MKKFLAALLLCAVSGMALNCAAGEAVVRDNFYWLGQINKATAVINTDEGLLTPEQGHRFAIGLQKVLEQGDENGGQRPGLVITLCHRSAISAF